MWIDVQAGPTAKRLDRRFFIVWDNCGPHNAVAVQSMLAAHGLQSANLPPNMTDELQVMDLVVNGPLKAAIRRHRSDQLYTEFQVYKTKFDAELSKPEAQRNLPMWAPPKPTLAQGLCTLFNTAGGELRTPKFAEGLVRSFRSVGLARDPATLLSDAAPGTVPSFRQYSRDRLPSLPRIPPAEDGFNDIAVEVGVQTRAELDVAAPAINVDVDDGDINDEVDNDDDDAIDQDDNDDDSDDASSDDE
jgi:hypothetical protein